MSIGVRIGPAIGSRVGSAIGVGADPIQANATNPMSGVAQDATSGKYLPANASQWTTTMAAAGLATGNPTYGWLCQESSGNLASFLTSCTLTAANAPSYSNAVSGWSTKAVGWSDGNTSSFSNTVTPPDGSTSSLALLCYQYVSLTPASTRFMGSLTTFAVLIQVGTGGNAIGSDNSAGTGVEVITDGVVRPFLIVYNRAASTCKLYTGVDKIDCTYASSSGVGVGLGASFGTSPTGGCLYATEFVGSAAELNDAQAKKLLQTLGWTISWS